MLSITACAVSTAAVSVSQQAYHNCIIYMIGLRTSLWTLSLRTQDFQPVIDSLPFDDNRNSNMTPAPNIVSFVSVSSISWRRRTLVSASELSLSCARL